jgi:hypothetical protein
LLDGCNRFEAIVHIKDAKHRVEIWKKASGNKVDVLGPQRDPLRLRHLLQPAPPDWRAEARTRGKPEAERCPARRRSPARPPDSERARAVIRQRVDDLDAGRTIGWDWPRRRRWEPA